MKINYFQGDTDAMRRGGHEGTANLMDFILGGGMDFYGVIGSNQSLPEVEPNDLDGGDGDATEPEVVTNDEGDQGFENDNGTTPINGR